MSNQNNTSTMRHFIPRTHLDIKEKGFLKWLQVKGSNLLFIGILHCTNKANSIVYETQTYLELQDFFNDNKN